MTLFVGAAAATLMPARSCAEEGKIILRVALSTDTLAGANINDARAAYRLWINDLPQGDKESTVVEAISDLFLPSEEMIRGFRQSKIDCIGATALEYAKVLDMIDARVVVLQSYLADGVEYVLLVHSDSRFKKLADLQSGQILSHLHRDMVLLPAWLSTMLAAEHLPAAEHFFGSLSPRDKVNQVLLPVFFRHADAACLARRSWETAVELNPQLGRDLRPLAVSPKVIPILFAFHSNCNPASRSYLLESIVRISSEIASKQITALFQSSGFVARPGSVMKGTLDLLRQSERVPRDRQARGR